MCKFFDLGCVRRKHKYRLKYGALHGLITKNVYDQFDLYRMEGGVFIKTGSISRHQVLLQMSKGAVFYAFCKETTQYAKLMAWYDRPKKSFYMRTDNKRVAADSFFLDMDAKRLIPYKEGETNIWATSSTLHTPERDVPSESSAPSP